MYRLIMAILTSEIGERIPCVAVFAIMMLLDYISGFLAAKRESIKYPDNSNFGLDSRVVVERNLEIVPQDQLEAVIIQDEDSIEILRFVGGG